MIITAKSNASKRTKSRLKEHPGVFTLKRTEVVSCLNGELAHLVESEDGWFGWLPASEVEFKE